MLKSMTGFGRASDETANLKVTVEIRCLNSRSLDVIMKTPAYFRECEQEIRQRMAEKLIRGKVDVWITLEVKNPAISGKLNTTLAEAYYHEMKAFSVKIGDGNVNILDAIFRMQDIFKSEDNTADEADIKSLMNALEQALDKVNEFRIKEGASLADDIQLRIVNIGKGLQAIEPYELPRVERYRTKLRENLNAALGVDAVDLNRFEEELIYYLEKIDITEEKVRLQSHLNYFKEASELSDPGRKLGFLSQEIGREINTIGSKANDADMQKIVVGMKDELEKVKEQLLNILKYHLLIPYNYIAIEGNIGAGKSTLSSLMADDLGATLVHESFADNPFLAEFYKNPEKNVFPLETSFLAERFLQLKNVFENPDIFRPMVISDYIFHKSLIFASKNLGEPELSLFRKLFEIMDNSLPKPDILIYLHRSTADLQQNILKRGRTYEQAIQNEYLDKIKEGYFEYFKTVNQYPVLMLNMDGLSFLGDTSNYKKLMKMLSEQEFQNGLNVIYI